MLRLERSKVMAKLTDPEIIEALEQGKVVTIPHDILDFRLRLINMDYLALASCGTCAVIDINDLKADDWEIVNE